MPDRAVFEVPAQPIAEARARYYICRVDKKPETGPEFREEVEHTVGDVEVLRDWLNNNMNWPDVEPLLRMVSPPPPTDYAEHWGAHEVEPQLASPTPPTPAERMERVVRRAPEATSSAIPGLLVALQRLAGARDLGHEGLMDELLSLAEKLLASREVPEMRSVPLLAGLLLSAAHLRAQTRSHTEDGHVALVEAARSLEDVAKRYGASATLPTVVAFALEMEATFARHRKKGDRAAWVNDHLPDLYARLVEEVTGLHELRGALLAARGLARENIPLELRERILREACDVANFAAIIADWVGSLLPLPEGAASILALPTPSLEEMLFGKQMFSWFKLETHKAAGQGPYLRWTGHRNHTQEVSTNTPLSLAPGDFLVGTRVILLAPEQPGGEHVLAELAAETQRLKLG